MLAPEITQRLIDRYVTEAPPDRTAPPELARLTAREREVLMLIARGLSNTEIARGLYLGEGTVKTHVVRIAAKLGLRDRVQVVVFAYERQLVRPATPVSEPRCQSWVIESMTAVTASSKISFCPGDISTP